MSSEAYIAETEQTAGVAAESPSPQRPVVRAWRAIAALPPLTRLLLGAWLLFFVLIAAGIHGSSLGYTANLWSPEKPVAPCLYDLLPGFIHRAAASHPAVRDFADAVPRGVRSDEFLIHVPWALSQFNHKPRFPVINTNIANGQNMLLWWTTPVWHITAIARPVTWGYLFLGQQRGLAWAWWFPTFACFTALSLLMKIILRGRWKLAAFAAFWFCASAYVVAWSLWPAYFAFFITLGVLCAYHFLRSANRWIQCFSALLLGLSIAGFIMTLYPPWQVGLSYLSVVMFAGLFIRDRLYLGLKSPGRARVIALMAAALIGAGLTASFLRVCWPDMKIMSDTVYPGHRVSIGGHWPLWRVFRGLYNLSSIYHAPESMGGNDTESASFYLLFPAILIGLCFSRRLAARMGIVGWLLIGYILVLIGFLRVGFPPFLARLTLFSYQPPWRADVAIGLGSIILCVYVHALAQDARRAAAGRLSRWDRAAPWIGAGGAFALFVSTGVVLIEKAKGFPGAPAVLLASLLAAGVSYFMLAGRTAAFCGVLGAVVVATTALFNPLSTRIDYVYDSEAARVILELNQKADKPPLWVGYGASYPNTLITLLGGRTLGGVQWPPQLELWHAFDPSRAYETAYNQYAHVHFFPEAEPPSDLFWSPIPSVVIIRVAPDNPVFRQMGVRYILAMGDMGSWQLGVPPPHCRVVYASPKGTFSVFEVE